MKAVTRAAVVASTGPLEEPRRNPFPANRLPEQFVASAEQAPPDFMGTVFRTIDGDSIRVLNDAAETVCIRLNGIDCPECGQPFGRNGMQLDGLWCCGVRLRLDPTVNVPAGCTQGQHGRSERFWNHRDRCVGDRLIVAFC